MQRLNGVTFFGMTFNVIDLMIFNYCFHHKTDTKFQVSNKGLEILPQSNSALVRSSLNFTEVHGGLAVKLCGKCLPSVSEAPG